jgi:hypothetical protein
MERITDKINALPDGANYFSLEFFPPKTAMVGLPHVRARGSKLTATLGLCEPHDAVGAHVAGSKAAVRDGDMGRGRLDCDQVSRTR